VVAAVIARSDRDEFVHADRGSLARLAGVKVVADQVLGAEERRAACVEDEEVHFRRSCRQRLGARRSTVEQGLAGRDAAGPAVCL